MENKNFAFPTVDIAEYLTQQGVEYKEKENWYEMSCILPGHDDKNPSFYIHKIHGGFNCFGCKQSGSWGKLLDLMGWKQDETIKIGVPNSVFWKDTKRLISKLSKGVGQNSKSFSIPKPFKLIRRRDRKFWRYLKSRNLTDLIEIFKLGWTTSKIYKKNYLNRVLVPVHDERGKIIFVEGRTILKKKKRKYYRPPKVQTQNILFNLHRIRKSNYVIVVEGVIDAMILYSYGFPAVCCFGSDLSDNQVLNLMSFDKVILAFDNDSAGINGFKKALLKFTDLGYSIYRVILPKKLDVNNLTFQKVVEKFNNPVKYL